MREYPDMIPRNMKEHGLDLAFTFGIWWCHLPRTYSAKLDLFLESMRKMHYKNILPLKVKMKSYDYTKGS